MILTIVTVNFNGAGDTVGLLRSLERQTDTAFDVIVVDNDSVPGDRALLAAHASTSPLNVELVLSGNNRGFSGGNNIGIRKALRQGSEWLLFLNNDTAVAPDFIASVRPSLNVPGIVGIPLEEGDHVTYGGRVRWLVAEAEHVYEPVADGTADRYAVGAAFAVHRAVFEGIGLMDERFFLYFEDVEFSLRAQRGGFPLRFIEGPSVWHAVSASTSRLGAPLLLRYHARNALLLNAIQGPWWARAALPFWSLFSMVKQLVKLAAMPARRAQSRAIMAGITDFYANRFGWIRPPDDRH